MRIFKKAVLSLILLASTANSAEADDIGNLITGITNTASSFFGPQKMPKELISYQFNFNDMPPTEEAASFSIQVALLGKGTFTVATLSNGETRDVNKNTLNKLYSLRGYRPIFVDMSASSQYLANIKDLLTQGAEDRGLKADAYWKPEFDAMMKNPNPKKLVALDMLLAQSYINFARDISVGATNPADCKQGLTDIELPKRKFSDYELLNEIANDPSFLEWGLAAIEPQSQDYQRIKQVLANLIFVREFSNRDGWPEMRNLNQGQLIHIGDNDVRLPGIRMRLADLGLLPNERREDPSTIYDQETADAVLKLQTGLKIGTDGVIGPVTFGLLNRPIDSFITQARANLERQRLLPHELGTDYVYVDLGSQKFKLVQNGQETLSMKVVVGQEARQTPTFIDQVDAVVFNPYWTAPSSIVVKDVLPHALQDPEYFAKLKMKVYKGKEEIDPTTIDWSQYSLENPPPFTFREEPGPNNSLGRLKFNLSKNSHAIYMHDTNHPELFNRSLRLFSSGCIRLEKPLEFAEALLGPQGLTGDKIRNALDYTYENGEYRNKAVPVKLDTPVKAYIVGTTMDLEDDGTVLFGPDVYKQDSRIVAAIEGKPESKCKEPVADAEGNDTPGSVRDAQ